MSAPAITIALVASVLALSACSSSSDAPSTGDGGDGTCSSASSFPTAPLSTVTSDSGKLSVAVHAAPYQPLVAGLQCVEIVVTDTSTGGAVDGLTVSMTPWMTAMGHGASVTPLPTALGEGRYVFTNVSLFMPGEWQLRVQLADDADAGQETDSVEPTFSVD